MATRKNKFRHAAKGGGLIVNQFVNVAYTRNRKDVGTLKAAIESAESVHAPNRARLYDLYHDLLTIDGHLSGILEKRTKAVANKTVMFVDAAGHKVEAMDGLISSERFMRLVEIIMDSLYWGCAAVEFDMAADFDFYELDKRHLRPEKRQIAKSQWDIEGVDVDTLPFCWLMGRPGDLGRLLQCSMYALYKRSGYGDFAQYVEIFGQPVRIVRYDAYDKQTESDLRRMLEESGGSLVMMLPKQADFQMLDGKSSNGNGELQQRLIDCCNREMSIAILGNTETTMSSSSSGYAQAAVHAGQQLEITKSDMRHVLNMLNSRFFLNVLAHYGYPVDGGRFVFEREQDLAQLKVRLQMDLLLAAKVPIADDYWYETYGLPKPANYEELKKKAAGSKKEDGGGSDGGTGTGTDTPRKGGRKDALKAVSRFFAKAPAKGA